MCLPSASETSATHGLKAEPTSKLVMCVNLYWVLIVATTTFAVSYCNSALVALGLSAGCQFCASAFVATEMMWWLPNVGVNWVFGAEALQPFRHAHKGGMGGAPTSVRASLWQMPYQLTAMRQARVSRVRGYWLDPLIYAITYACSARRGAVVATNLAVGFWPSDSLELCSTALTFVGMLLYFDFMSFLLHWAMHTRVLYRRYHKEHHDVRHLSPWANDIESDAEGLLNVFMCKATTVILAAWLGLLQERPWLIVAFYAFTKWYGVMEHLNMTLPPLHILLRWKQAGHPLCSLLSLPDYHDDHHRYSPDAEAVGHLAVYTTFWDRLFAPLVRRTTVAKLS
mmetsp:Transcript_24980/g.69845  ORF Transcript_24980/g.69845 Transcript_24980/m.69845 type:complete len:340 (+) Transcript_24980:2-1021(+)